MASSVAEEGDSPLLTLVKNQFVDFEDNTVEYHDEARTMRQYYDNYQWTDAERKKIEARGQPVITDNKIKDKIETMLGVEKQRRTDPKALPRNNPSDEKAAEAATDGLRYVADDNQWPFEKSTVAEDLFIEGVAGVQTTVDKKLPKNSKVPKVRVKRIRPDRQYWDHHSAECDFSDGEFRGFITWMDISRAKKRWPDKTEILDKAIELGGQHTNRMRSTSSTSEVFDDKPRWATNVSGRQRVQVFTHEFEHDGVVKSCEFVGSGFLEEPQESAYQNDEGEPDYSIEYQALYKEGDTNRPYGAIRRYRDLQDDWNKRRSKSTHLLNTNQVIMEDGAAGAEPNAIEKIRKEAARPDGVITHMPGTELALQKNLDLAQGHVLLMEMTGRALDSTGPNAAIQGQGSGSQSGRAKQLDAVGGLIAIDKPFDQLRYLTLRVFRQMWNRISQFWKEETWIRVRDEEALKFIPLNRTITRAELLAEEIGKQSDISDEDKMELIANIAANPAYREELKQNDVSQLDVDILIDESPDVVTLQQEEFATIAELANNRPEVPFSVVLEASSLRSDVKRKIKEAMDPQNDAATRQLSQFQEAMSQLTLLLQEAKVRSEAAKAAKAEADAAESSIDATIKTARHLEGEDKPSVSIN